LPLNYEGNILVGDHVVVQHNVFRYFDGQGIQENQMHILRIIFTKFCPINLFDRGDKTISVDNYVFVEPIIIDEKWVGKRITARRNS
jgi:hypothetical protein